MKTVLVIGMSRFGRHLSLTMAELGNEVMIIDKDETAVQQMMDHVTRAQIGDCREEEVLRSIGVRNFDICFVCVGDDFQCSLEVTSLCRDLGAKYVISRANRDVQAKFLLRNGADEVIYPERNAAEKLAKRCSFTHVFDYIELSDEYSIYEIPVPDGWVGKTIIEVDVRAKYHVSIIACKSQKGQVEFVPGANWRFEPDEHLMIVGKQGDVDKILKRL